MVKASGTAPESQRKSGQPSYSNFVKRMMPASYRLATIGSGVCGAAPPLITLPRLGRLSAPFSSSDYGKCSSSIPAVSWPLRLTCDPNKVNYSGNPYQTLRPNYTIHNQNLWKRPPKAARRTTGRKPKRPLPKVLVTELLAIMD